MTTLQKFPDRSFKCRMAARLPRRSKNGTPEEREAAKQKAAGEVVPMTRRAILAGAAALPSLAMPAIASATVDPIFAVIADHERSERDYRAANLRGAPDETIDPLFDGEGDQFAELLGATPTTLAGCVAFLRYLQAYGERWDVRPVFGDYVTIETSDDLFARLANTIEAVQS